MLDRLLAYGAWIEQGRCKIKDRRGRLVSLKFLPVQERLYLAVLQQARQGKPIRIMNLKARKEGVSTFWESLAYFLGQHTPHFSGRVIAHTIDSTRDIFAIARRMAHHAPQGFEPEIARVGALSWPHDAELTLRTAGGEYVSSGANSDFGHLSELAKWSGTAEFVKAQLASILQSIPDVPETVVAIESTANMVDSSGQFRVMWEAAKHQDSIFLPFFIPWIEDPSYRIRGAPLDAPTEYEQWAQRVHGVTDEQLAWRRRKIATDFAGDERYFKQEYPLTEDEAWQNPTGAVFPMLRRDRNDARVSLEELRGGGWSLYRGIDFGGIDPFTCVWAAHRPGPPGLTVDVERCPKTWQELTSYAWGLHGLPRDVNDHLIDPLRYIITFYNLTGHVHVYRELYVPEFALSDRSILDLAGEIKVLSGDEQYVGSVADRSRSDSIQLLNHQGLRVMPNTVPGHISGLGEKIDAIMRMQALILATVPLVYERPPRPWQQEMNARRRELPISVGLCSHEMMVELSKYPELPGADPLFGSYI